MKSIPNSLWQSLNCLIPVSTILIHINVTITILCHLHTEPARKNYFILQCMLNWLLKVPFKKTEHGKYYNDSMLTV